MSRPARRCLLLWALALPALTSVHAKQPIQWRTATVLHAQYQVDRPSGVVTAGGATTTVRGEFDFEADTIIYTAEEWVTPQARMELLQGDTVQFTVEKKSLLLRIDDKKVRRLKILQSYPKERKFRIR